MTSDRETMNQLERLVQVSSQAIYTDNPAAEHVPVALLIGSTEDPERLSLVSIPNAMNSEEGKDQLRLFFESAVQTGTRAIALVTEGWLATAAAAGRVLAEHRRVSSLPPDDRIEVLIAHIVTRSGERFRVYRIVRDKTRTTLVRDPALQGTSHAIRSRFLSDLTWPAKTS